MDKSAIRNFAIEVMLINNQTDLEKFKAMYGINEEIVKEY